MEEIISVEVEKSEKIDTIYDGQIDHTDCATDESGIEILKKRVEAGNMIPPVESVTILEQSTYIRHSEIFKKLLGEIKPINFPEVAGITDGSALKKNHYAIISIEMILKIANESGLSLCMTNGNVYAFNGAYWKEQHTDTFKKFISDASEKLGLSRFTAQYHVNGSDLLKQFYATAFLPKPERQGLETVINLKNGSFVIKPDSRFLKPFDKNDFLTYQLAFEFEPKAKCPQFDAYLDKCLPDKELQYILAEFIGSVFIKNRTHKLEKVLILKGTGANGKSLFQEIIIALLGQENVSSYSLKSLTNETGYYRANIADKLLNYCSEITADMNEGLFKQLASGEPIEARLPYKDPIIITDYAKLMFNANEFPDIKEKSDAVFRRMLIVPFEVTIPEAERDTSLASKIIMNELPGILNWVFDGLNRLLINKGFSSSSAAESVLKKYKEESDPVFLFLTDGNYAPSIANEISLQALFYEYCEFCRECLYKPVSNRKFAERLRYYKYKIERKRLGAVVNIKKVLV